MVVAEGGSVDDVGEAGRRLGRPERRVDILVGEPFGLGSRCRQRDW